MRTANMAEALREAMEQEMARDSSVILLGEDVGLHGGAFHLSAGFTERFGADRCRDTPISEAGYMGMGIGAALTGLRPIIEFQYMDFMFCAMDQIANQAAKIRLMCGGKTSVPLVIRGPQGASGRGAQHSQSLEAYFMHTPGLKLVMPSTPYDAKGLLLAAIRDPDPVVFLEHKLLYGAASPGGGGALSDTSVQPIGTEVPEEPYTIPLGQADIKREGSDVTVIATSLMVHKALAAAERLAGQNISVEVVDPRSLVPLDRDTIVRSVHKTRRAVVVSEDCYTGGITAELAAMIGHEAFDYLDAPVERVAAFDTPIPFAPACEFDVIPQVQDIVAAVRRTLDE